MTVQRPTATAIVALCALFAAGVTAQAQGRFDPVAREAVAAVPDLEVVSVRDRALNLQHLVETQRTVTVPNPLRYHVDGLRALADFDQVAREASLARIDARLAEIAAAPRLAVAGPSRCPSATPEAEPLVPGGRP